MWPCLPTIPVLRRSGAGGHKAKPAALRLKSRKTAVGRQRDEGITDCESAPTRARVDAHSVSWSSQTSATARHTLSKPVRAPLSRLEAEISGKISVQLPTHLFPPHCFKPLAHNRQPVTVFSSQLPFFSLVLGHLFAYLVTHSPLRYQTVLVFRICSRQLGITWCPRKLTA